MIQHVGRMDLRMFSVELVRHRIGCASHFARG
jgi:hypothetical protein